MSPLQHFWGKIYQDNAPRLIGICRRYVASRELAEDLVHDAFVAAINKHSTYNGRGSLEGWLRTIVINTALMHLRKEKKNSVSHFLEVDDPDTTEISDNTDLRGLIENAGFSDDDLLQTIDKLPDHHKVVFNLYVMDNYSHKQIASELNISQGTSKSHLARARKLLQKLLYEKIMADKEEKRKSKVAVFIPFTSKANYIDQVFGNQLSGLQIKPLRDPQILFSGLMWENMAKPTFIKKQVFFATVQTAKYVTLVTCIVLTTICTFKYVFSGEENNIHPLEKAVILDQPIKPQRIDQPITSISDTLANKDIIKNMNVYSTSGTDTAKSANPLHIDEPDTSEKHTVVVKKVIIQRQTVEVQKTIEIYDSADAR